LAKKSPYAKLVNKLFYLSVRKIQFMLAILLIGFVVLITLAHYTYVGKYLEIDNGVVMTDAYGNSKIRIVVEANMVQGIMTENNIMWYKSADSIRYEATIKEKNYDGEGKCIIILQTSENGANELNGSDNKVYVVARYAKKYIL